MSPDTVTADIAELKELEERVFARLDELFACKESSFTISYSTIPDDWICQSMLRKTPLPLRPGFRFWPDRIGETLAAWRGEREEVSA